MAYDREAQESLNESALKNPKVGDYWHERFCPYFQVVRVQGDQITVLSALSGGINARVAVDDNSWAWDYDKHMVVDRAWIEKTVKYGNIVGFVADAARSPKLQSMADEWREHQVKKLRAEWEDLTGWSALQGV